MSSYFGGFAWRSSHKVDNYQDKSKSNETLTWPMCLLTTFAGNMLLGYTWVRTVYKPASWSPELNDTLDKIQDQLENNKIEAKSSPPRRSQQASRGKSDSSRPNKQAKWWPGRMLGPLRKLLAIFSALRVREMPHRKKKASEIGWLWRPERLWNDCSERAVQSQKPEIVRHSPCL